jgi:UDP-N-acetyl-2-amino-2-deoxyglucuronate dehydrogenase
MKTYNVGIIGYGWVASAHIPAINASSQAQVTAVCSSRPQDEAELTARHGSPIRAFTDLDAMLADPSIHVVSICSFSKLHAEHAIKAARAGKHLIIEKPIALSWDDCLEVDRAIEESGVKACVCFECRFSSQFITTRSVIDQGLLGDLHYGEVDYFHGIGPWYGQFEWNAKRDGGGSALLTAGCHALDALLLCLGSDVKSVSSFSTKSGSPVFAPYEYPTSSVTILHFTSGKVGKCAAVVDCLQPYYFHTHLCGSEGSLLDNKYHSRKLHEDRAVWKPLEMTMLDSGDVSDHPYQTQFQAFFDALDAGTTMPLTDFKTALHTHRVVFAADESARTGQTIIL